MNSFVKCFPIAAILTLTMATTASAIQPVSKTATNIKLTGSQSLIAQKEPRSRLQNETRSRRFVDKMISLHMQMVEAAEEALQSKDPEIKRMAHQTIKDSNASISRMMQMRAELYRYLDEGIGDDAT